MWVNEKHHLMANSCAAEATAVLPLGCLGNVTAKKRRASLNTFVSVWTSCRLWSVQIVLSGLHHYGDGHSAEENSVIEAHPHETRFKIDLWMGSRQEEHLCNPEGVRM